MTRKEYLAFVKTTFRRIEAIIEAKNSDYCGESDDPFFNLSLTEHMSVVSTQKGIFCRITDKYSRLASFLSGAKMKVKDENLQDTLYDLVGYTMLLLATIEKKRMKK